MLIIYCSLIYKLKLKVLALVFNMIVDMSIIRRSIIDIFAKFDFKKDISIEGNLSFIIDNHESYYLDIKEVFILKL